MCPAVPYNAGDREETPMPNDVRDLPAGNDGLYRFLGGSPLAVAFRLILLSILVGVVLAAIGFDPWNILHSIQMLFRRLWISALTPSTGCGATSCSALLS